MLRASEFSGDRDGEGQTRSEDEKAPLGQVPALLAGVVSTLMPRDVDGLW